MPTLQEDRETYNNRIRENMEFLMHGDTNEVAKSGLQKAQDLKSVAAENRGAANTATSYAPARSAAPVNASTANYAAPAVAAPHHNALRPDVNNYRNKFERPQNSAGASVDAAPAASAYDGLNRQITGNARFAQERTTFSNQAKVAFDDVTTREAKPASTVTVGDMTPNAVLNRMPAENVVTPTPTTVTATYQTVIDTAREEAIRRQREKRAQNVSAGIPTQVKVIAAVIAAAIILAFTVIFINSALLNTLNIEMNQLSVKLETLQTDAASLQAEIEEAQSYEKIAEYAKSAGMVQTGE